MISIVLVTFNRLHLLKRSFRDVLSRTSPLTRQIIIWNNNSTDGTGEYLSNSKDKRMHVVNHSENIGTNAYARAFKLATEPYLIELDDDVIEAPQNWDVVLLENFKKAASIGYLASNIIDDGKSVSSQVIHHRDLHLYQEKKVNGVKVLEGPTGGWCTMTSREIYDEVGGFRENKRFRFWHEDAAYAAAVRKSGYTCALLKDLKVFHASGPAYSSDPVLEATKLNYYSWRDRRVARRTRIKQVLERIPLIHGLNRKLRLYQPPKRS